MGNENQGHPSKDEGPNKKVGDKWENESWFSTQWSDFGYGTTRPMSKQKGGGCYSNATGTVLKGQQDSVYSNPRQVMNNKIFVPIGTGLAWLIFRRFEVQSECVS